MRFKPLKLGKSKDESKEDTIEFDAATAEQLNEINESISSRTRSLEETTQRLQDLSDTLNYFSDEDDTPKPHGPLVELTVEPEDKMMDIDLDTMPDEELLDTSADEIKVVEVSKQATKPAKLTESGKSPQDVAIKPDAAESEDDSFSNLFGTEEEESNPLATLINSLPDVSAQEIIDDLEEIKNIIKDNRKHG